MVIVATVMLFPTAIVYYYINTFGLDFPYGSNWGLAPLLAKLGSENALTFSDFFRFTNGHVVVFPDLLSVASIRLLDTWNIKVELFIGLAVAALNTMLLCWIAFRTKVFSVVRTNQFIYTLLIALIFSVLLLTLRQAENWVLGGQLRWHLLVFGVLATVACLLEATLNTVPRMYKFMLVLATFSATIASFSISSGLLIWPIFLVFFILEKKLRIYMFPWLCVTGMIGSLFFWNDSIPTVLAEMQVFSFEMHFNYVAIILANSIQTSATAGYALLIFFVLLSVCAYWFYRNEVYHVTPWVVIGGFVVISAVLMSFGRLELGLMQAASTRYVILSSLFVIAMLALLILLIIKSRRFERLILLVCFVSLASLGVLSSYAGQSVVKETHQAAQSMQSCVWEYGFVTDDCLKVLFADTSLVRQGREVIIQNGWETIALSTDQLPVHQIAGKAWQTVGYDSSLGYVDVIERKGQRLLLTGWALHPYIVAEPSKVLIVSDDKLIGELETGWFREDVAAFWQNDIYMNSGWQGYINTEADADTIKVYLQINNKILQTLN